MVGLARVEQVAAPEPGRRGEEHAAEAVLAAFDLADAVVEDVQVVDVDGPGRGEVAFLRVVGALLVLHAGDQLGDEEVVVGVALAVGVGRQVDGRAHHPGREVRAVVDVEAADVVLVGLAFPAVLADQHPRHALEDLARAKDRPLLDLLRAHHPLRARAGQTQEAVHGLVEIGEATESPPAGHEHVGVERNAKRDLEAGGARGRQVHGPHGGGKARQTEIDLVAARRQTPDLEGSLGAGRRRAVDSPGARMDAHGDSRKGTAALVVDDTLDAGRGRGLG